MAMMDKEESRDYHKCIKIDRKDIDHDDELCPIIEQVYPGMLKQADKGTAKLVKKQVQEEAQPYIDELAKLSGISPGALRDSLDHIRQIWELDPAAAALLPRLLIGAMVGTAVNLGGMIAALQQLGPHLADTLIIDSVIRDLIKMANAGLPLNMGTAQQYVDQYIKPNAAGLAISLEALIKQIAGQPFKVDRADVVNDSYDTSEA